MDPSRDIHWRYYSPIGMMRGMFLCECHRCGRRELRGPRSLFTIDGAFAATCRRCGSTVAVAGARANHGRPAAVA